MTGPGQPNGKPVQADIPEHLPYGERGSLLQQIHQTPAPPRRTPGRPMPPPPATFDANAPGAFEQHIAPALAGFSPNVTPINAATERPAEAPQTGLIGRPDSVLGLPQPGGVGDLLQQVAEMTGSAEMASLATRAQAIGA